MMLVYCTCVW